MYLFHCATVVLCTNTRAWYMRAIADTNRLSRRSDIGKKKKKQPRNIVLAILCLENFVSKISTIVTFYINSYLLYISAEFIIFLGSLMN